MKGASPPSSRSSPGPQSQVGTAAAADMLFLPSLLIGKLHLSEMNIFFNHPFPTVLVFPENKPLQGLPGVSLDQGGKVISGAAPWDKAKGSEVSVTFTLSAAAAKVTTLQCLTAFLYLSPCICTVLSDHLSST